MSYLSYQDEKQIYKHLCKAYTVEDGYVVVWRGDRETKGADTRGGWYDMYANIDFEIYKTDGSIEIPEDKISASEASALHKQLKTEFPKDIIYIEAKTRTFKDGQVFKQAYKGLYMNNHLEDSLKHKYPIFLKKWEDSGKYYVDKHHPDRVVPPITLPTSENGKINQTLEKLKEPGSKFFYITKDGNTGKFWVAELTTDILKTTMSSQPKAYEDNISQLAKEGKGEPRWEKNYDILWKYWHEITDWNLDNHRNKPIDITKLPAHIFEKRAVNNALKAKAKAEADALANLHKTKPIELEIPSDAHMLRLIEKMDYVGRGDMPGINKAFLRINKPNSKYEIKEVEVSPRVYKKIIYHNDTPVLITPKYIDNEV